MWSRTLRKESRLQVSRISRLVVLLLYLKHPWEQAWWERVSDSQYKQSPWDNGFDSVQGITSGEERI